MVKQAVVMLQKLIAHYRKNTASAGTGNGANVGRTTTAVEGGSESAGGQTATIKTSAEAEVAETQAPGALGPTK